MKYYGGKSKIGHQIYQILIEIMNKNNIKSYLEPFCGSLSVTKHFINDNIKLYATDANKDLIMLYKSLKNDTFIFPKNISLQEYQLLKNEKSSALRGFVGIAYSYGGGWFNGYCNIYEKDGVFRNYPEETKKSLINLQNIIKKINFKNVDYKLIEPKGFLIYCDPPYKNTCQKYNNKNSNFNTEEFWNIVRKWSKNNIVVVSELTAPSDFKCIWKHEYNSGINKTGTNRIEKLFIKK